MAVAPLGALVLSACQNAGGDRVLSIGATARLEGFAYFDADGDRRPGPSDPPLAGVGVRLVARGTRDTIASAVSDAQGEYTIAALPVGSYLVAVDTTNLGDSVRVARVDTSLVTVAPNDTVALEIAISYPRVTVTEARALPAGTKVFAEGVALNARETFSDTTVHLADAFGGSIRATRVRRGATTFVSGDSLRMLGTRRTRDGQPVLDDVTVFVLGVGFDPPASLLTTAGAAAAQGGSLDAALARVENATVQDTAMVLGNRELTVDDGSGILTVVLDRAAGPFRDSLYVPGRALDVAGVLVPKAGGGSWRLKPRSDGDIIRR